MAPLSWRYHTLIQALLSHGPLKEEEFHEIFGGVSGKNPATHQQLFNDVLLKINKELAYVQFELRACRNQYDGTVYYGVVNTVADDQSKLGTKYSVPQIAFYKGVIEAIVHDSGPEGSISNIEALNIRLENQIPEGSGLQDGSQTRIIPSAFKTFSMSQKEKTLRELVQDKWFCYTCGGNKIGLGVRSFLDLRSWFRNNNIPSCDVCNEASIKASICPNEACNVRIHNYCLKKKFSQRKGSRACPGCNTEWPRSETETEEQENQETQVTSNNNNNNNNSNVRKRLRRAKAGIVDTDQNQNQNQSQSQEPIVTSARKKLRSGCKTEAADAPSQGVMSVGSSQPVRSSRRTRVRNTQN